MQSPHDSELTLRAVAAGAVLGALLAAGNVYAGLKIGYLDGGSISASVVAFAFFSAMRGVRRYSALENNLTQTVAAAAALMAPTASVIAAIPALAMAGRHYPSWAIMLWAVALAALGIAIARGLRQRLLISDGLAFPTGRATGEVIHAMHATRGGGLGRARVLLVSALVAALITWFRDAQPILPQALFLPFGDARLRAASVGLGVSLSPLVFASGALVGPRAGTSVLLGGIVSWGILAPAILTARWVNAADYASLLGWLLWPGVALLLACALTSFALDWRSIWRSLRDLEITDLSASSVGSPVSRLQWAWRLIVVACFAAVAALAWLVFHVNPLITLAGLLLSVIFAGVSARAAGETDIAPVGAMGAIGQIALGSAGFVTSLISGAVVAGPAAQTAQTMWAFKAGQRLDADYERQALGQMLGSIVGAIVVVPVYQLVVAAYGLGTPVMPAPSAVSWKATADAVQLGTAAMPSHAGIAAIAAGVLGIVLTLLAKTRAARFLPSPIAIGIAFVVPATLSSAIFVGACCFAVLRWRRPEWSDERVPLVAAGAIAGESLIGVAIAGLIAFGLVSP